MHTILPSTIWTNNDFIELNDDHKLCYFWMQTNANTAGYVSVSPKRLKRDIDIDFQCFEEACQVMGDNFHRMEGGVWIRDYIRLQIGEGEKLAANKMSATVVKHLIKDSPQILQEMVLNEYPTLHRRLEEYLRPKEALTKPSPRGFQGEGEGEGGGGGY